MHAQARTVASALGIDSLEFLMFFTPAQRKTLASYHRDHTIVGIPTLVRGEVAFEWRHTNDKLGWTTTSLIRANGVAYFDTRPASRRSSRNFRAV